MVWFTSLNNAMPVDKKQIRKQTRFNWKQNFEKKIQKENLSLFFVGGLGGLKIPSSKALTMLPLCKARLLKCKSTHANLNGDETNNSKYCYYFPKGTWEIS